MQIENWWEETKLSSLTGEYIIPQHILQLDYIDKNTNEVNMKNSGGGASMCHHREFLQKGLQNTTILSIMNGNFSLSHEENSFLITDSQHKKE